MHSIATRGNKILDKYISEYSHYDYMMFVFGEPDVRIHFDKQINIIKRDEEEVINTLCTLYINSLRDIVPPREYSMFGVDNNIYRVEH